MAAKTVKVIRREMTLTERFYLREAFQGMAITLRHFFVNWAGRLFGTKSYIVTTEYPEQKRPVNEWWRGKHRLMTREDGTMRCVACLMCSTACPANCINIVPGEYDPSGLNAKYEKYPLVFEIDELKCVFCGLCVEACPCDAIRMDTGIYALASLSRDDLYLNKNNLLQDGPFIPKGSLDPRYKDGELDVTGARVAY